MSGVRIQRFRRPDRVRLADHVVAIPAYSGKPRVGCDTVPVSSTISRAGSKRDPYQVVAMNGAGHFFDVDEMTRVDIPTYDRIPAPEVTTPGSRSVERADDPTLFVRVRPRWEAALALAFLAGFALAAVVVYLAMR